MKFRPAARAGRHSSASSSGGQIDDDQPVDAGLRGRGEERVDANT